MLEWSAPDLTQAHLLLMGNGPFDTAQFSNGRFCAGFICGDFIPPLAVVKPFCRPGRWDRWD
jgi:hypothetical protein